ncbi:LexA family protein [Mesorhizobium sp. Cs1299R1N3]|uniref:LexA family protein n=1 Tax=Mesorhizobium sp. Cs1299R1N3 TaxID=3015173 RepID=UPI00301C2B89
MSGVTRRQEQVLDFIAGELRAGKRTPTYDEICAHLGLKSRSSAHYLVAFLIEAGRLRKVGTRELQLVGGAEDHLRAVLEALSRTSGSSLPAVRRAQEFLEGRPMPTFHVIPYAGAA